MPTSVDRPLFIQAPALAKYTMHLRHGFFGRQGGVSGGVYTSLNAGLGSDDALEAVIENRARICTALGGDPKSMVTVHQCHSNRAVIVDAPFAPGQAPEADAIVTRTPGLVLTALAADCAPLLMCDPHANVAAAVHAGWRGAVSGVIESALEAMVQLKADPANVIAAVGPCISQDSFEVGPDLESDVLDASPWAHNLFEPGQGDRLQFDLKRYCLHRLARAGVGKAEAIAEDTVTEPVMFHSYRRSKSEGADDYGRNASSIMLL